MQASTFRDAADTLSETVSDLAHTVAELTPEVTSKVGDTALKLAALTPWVDERSTSWFRRRWALAIAGLAALGVLGWWLKSKRTNDVDFESVSGTSSQDRTQHRLRAAAGN
jgi:hypothetical protein